MTSGQLELSRRSIMRSEMPFMVALLLACIAAGLVAAQVSRPSDLVLGVVGVLAVVIVTYAGMLPILVLLLVLVPSAPVGTHIAGHDWSEIRTAGLILCSAVLLVVYWRDLRVRLSGSVQLACASFAALIPLGVVAALYTSSGSADLLKTVSQAAGQPFSYAVLLGVFFLAIEDSSNARWILFGAWALALAIQALVSLGQYVSGSAFDPSLGYDRATGTMGSDFLGAFALLSLFAALYVRAAATGPATRRVATAATAVAGLTLVASLSRSALIALGIGLLVLIVNTTRRPPGIRSGRSVLLVLAVIAAGLFLTSGIWSQRLSSQARGFDRPAGWLSGLRIAADYPWTGVGPSHVDQFVRSKIRYGYTPYGENTDNPSNTWIFALSAEGIPYGIVLVIATTVIVGLLIRGPPSLGRKFLGLGLLTSGIIFIVNNLFTHPDNMIFVLLTMALLLVDRAQAIAPDGSVSRVVDRQRGHRGATTSSRLGRLA